MFSRFVTGLVCTLLKGAFLSHADRSLLTACMLDKLRALPAGDILSEDVNGTLTINGKTITADKAHALRRSANRVLNSEAWKLVSEQVRFKAVTIGVHAATSDAQNFFAKTAIWNLNELQILLGTLGGLPDEDDDLDIDD